MFIKKRKAGIKMAFIELDLRSGYLNSHEEVWMILPDEKPPKDGYPVLWLFHGAHQDLSLIHIWYVRRCERTAVSHRLLLDLI